VRLHQAKASREQAAVSRCAWSWPPGAGSVNSFPLNRHVVFAPSGKSVGVEAFWFALVNVLAVAQALVISLLLADVALPALGVEAFRGEIAHAIGIMVPAVTRYFGHKHLSCTGSRG